MSSTTFNRQTEGFLRGFGMVAAVEVAGIIVAALTILLITGITQLF